MPHTLQTGDDFQCNYGHLHIQQFLGKGKSGYSYLAQHQGRLVVLKRIHQEPCEYYQFPPDKTACEVEAYHRLQAIGIQVPQLYYADTERQLIIKEFIDAPTVVEAFAKRPLPDTLLQQLFHMAQRAQRHQHNLDYFPTNFVFSKNKLYYVDYELNGYASEWDLLQWGLYYWANLQGVQKYLADHDFLHINQSLEHAKPIRGAFAPQVAQWVAQYA